ncbi:hypothetical protein BDQ17DRAFT_1355811 [Cyathus striatus]|nr:hypothetical protein BDQ17DRAFT_1355811 [Cyathus striatus]
MFQSWHDLPNEIKLAIVDALSPEDVKAFKMVDQRTYQACVPSTFKIVHLNSYDALQRFLDNVPRGYCSHIQELHLSTQDPDTNPSTRVPPIPLRTRTDAVIALLSATPSLASLTLTMAGSLDKSLIAPFPFLNNLKQLDIANCGDEASSPLSERLVVSIAASVPHLEELTLDRISRSKLHAPELVGVYPYIPLVVDDYDIPNHPILGSDLRLPSLLRIPSLRKLAIRDTHLGDENWTTTEVACRLQVVDLGSCYHENEDFNRSCTERIMSAVGPSVDEFSLTTAVSETLFAKPSITPMQRLRKLHITPFFPVDSVVETVSNMAGSPIENLSMQCYEDDVVDVCNALEEFLTVRAERGPDFFSKLQRIDVSITSVDDSCPATLEETEERVEAARRLQHICRELRLQTVFDKFAALAAEAPRSNVISFTDARRVKGRSNSI